MKDCLGIRSVVFAASCSTLLLGCQGTEGTADPEAEAKCSYPAKTLPARFEAEEVTARVSKKASQKIEKDSAASKKKVHSTRFQGQERKLDYSLLTYNADDAEVWIRVRTGSDQGIFQAWVDDSTSAVTLDGYSETQAFVEAMIGTLPSTQSAWGATHTVHMQVTGKNPSSSAYAITVDFVELRVISSPSSCLGKPDGTPCNDNDACTRADECLSGTCVGLDPVVCQPLDSCHVAGTCNATTGTCSTPPAPDGTACDDNNLCTQSDTCNTGLCIGSNPVICPYLPNCAVQGVCVATTGLCSAATECTDCGNGRVDAGEQCDDGNRYDNDGCSASCMAEFCGDGIVQPPVMTLTFVYLGRACNLGTVPIIFRLNGKVVAKDNLPETCDCQPGIRTLSVTDPALRAVGFNGINQFEIVTDGELAWAIAGIGTRVSSADALLWDLGGNNDAATRNPDICKAQSALGVLTGSGSPIFGGETCDDGNESDNDGCPSGCGI